VYVKQEELSAATGFDGSMRVFRQIICDASIRVLDQIKHYPYADELPSCSLIIGIQIGARSELVHVESDGSVATATEPIFVGIGAGTAIAFSRILLEEMYSLETMKWIAFFLLYQSKVSVSHCGGSTNIAVLPRTNPRTSGLYDDEGIAEKVGEAMRLTLIHSRDLEMTQEKFEEKLASYIKDMRDVRAAMVQGKFLEGETLKLLANLKLSAAHTSEDQQ